MFDINDIKILNIIKKNHLPVTDLDLYTNEIAKIKSITPKNNPSKLIVVTAMNPPLAGAGKTTISIGLLDGLNANGYNAIGALREPSMGPVFGMKGTGSGGGLAKLEPFDKINLLFTGDFNAIMSANNLISAIIDNEIWQESELNIDPQRVLWKRCEDLNDRALREVILENINRQGESMKTSFNITAASDMMALFCLANSHEDMRQKLENTLVAYSRDNKEIRIKDLNIIDALMTILNDALYPNLVSTTFNSPCLVHGGPFANIAHGCNSVIATKLAMQMADYVVTECGFGSDLGLEKFCNIKMGMSGLEPSAICLVVSIRATYEHGTPNNDRFEQIKSGFKNILAHISHIKQYKVPYMAVINKYETDDPKELELLQTLLKESNINYGICDSYTWGTNNSKSLVDTLIETINSKSNQHIFKTLYEPKDSLMIKLHTIAKKVYHADDVILSEIAQKQLKELEKFENYYICYAKNPYSLSDDAKALDVINNHKIHIDHFEINHAANIIIPVTNSVIRMPGLNKNPAAKNFKPLK